MTSSQTMHGRTARLAGASVLALLLLAACGGGGSDGEAETPAPAPEPVPVPAPSPAIYDDFSAPRLAQDRWLDLEARRMPGSVVLEQAANGNLGTQQDLVLRVTDPASVRSISAPVTVEEASITSDSADTFAHARVIFPLFNDGTPGEGSTGDVGAQIALRHLASGDLVSLVGAFRCDNANCTASTGQFSEFDFTPVAIGQAHNLAISWDAVQREVTFSVDGESRTVPINVVPAGPPRSTFAGFDTRITQLGTTADRSGYIRARIGAVQVNGAPYDDFSSGSIDPARWQQRDFERRIVDGALHLRGVGHNGINATTQARVLQPEDVRRIAADMSVVSASSAGMEPRARIHGFWYNTGVDGDGATGDLYADVTLVWDGSELRGRATVVRCDNPSCGAFTVVLNDTDSLGSFSMGQVYPASVSWDGTLFRFELGTQSVEYVPTGIAVRTGPARAPQRALATRIAGGGAGSTAAIHATFDNVVVERN